MNRGIFLDRDGVLNQLVKYRGEKDHTSPRCIGDFHMFAGIEEIITDMKKLRFIPICITNQPDIDRCKLSEEDLFKMNNLVKATGIMGVYYCPHTSEDSCECRKPRIGMLKQAAEEFNIDLRRSFMIGDSWRDVHAGRNVECTTCLIVNKPVMSHLYMADIAALDLGDAWNQIKSILAKENYPRKYLEHIAKSAGTFNTAKINHLVQELIKLRNRNGRLFFIGVGGGAGISSHAACDFRKTTGIESYAPVDAAPEFTATINDEGWNMSFVNYLKHSNFNENDALFVFSVGGGNEEKNISINIVEAVKYAKDKKSKIFGIVSAIGGYTGKFGDIVLFVPSPQYLKTAITESFQSVILHLLVTHPDLQINKMKWESMR